MVHSYRNLVFSDLTKLLQAIGNASSVSAPLRAAPGAAMTAGVPKCRGAELRL